MCYPAHKNTSVCILNPCVVSFKFRPLYSQGPNASTPQRSRYVPEDPVPVRTAPGQRCTNSRTVLLQDFSESGVERWFLDAQDGERRGAGQKQHDSHYTKVVQMIMITKAHYRWRQIPIKWCFLCNNFLLSARNNLWKSRLKGTAVHCWDLTSNLLKG